MCKIIRYTGYLLLLFFSSCTASTQKKQQVLTIKTLSYLATTEHTVTKIIKVNDNQNWFTVGDRKILLSCQASIKSGIDLSQLSEDDITINGNQISIRLPPPQLISLSMPPSSIKVEYEEVGLLRDTFTNTERDALMVQAEQQLRNSLEEMGIYQKTREHCQLFFIAFFRQLGFENSRIFFEKEKPF
jgi:hypothetical protein